MIGKSTGPCQNAPLSSISDKTEIFQRGRGQGGAWELHVAKILPVSEVLSAPWSMTDSGNGTFVVFL
jgi:hypothetical protein